MSRPVTQPVAEAGAARPSTGRTWLLAIRPATLPAAVSGVVVGLGAALAAGVPFRLDAALGCLAVALLLQIAANLANDLSDFRAGADTPDRTGPVRVAAAGLVTERQLEIAIGVVVALAGLVGLGLVAVVGTAYLQAGSVAPLFVAAAIPVGCLITAILVVNNLRDIPTDAAAGKRTLAVVLGRERTALEYVLLVTVAYVTPLFLAEGLTRWPVLLPILSLPLAWPLIGRVRSFSEPGQLNPVLKGTARLALVHSLLFGAGLALAGAMA